MVDRVEQKPGSPYHIDAPNDSTKHSKDEEDNPQQEARSFFEEKTDWKLFYEKTPHRTKPKTLLTRDIEHIRFQSVSLKNDPSILEVEIEHKNGSTESPAFISIPRDMAFRLQHHHKGDVLPKPLLCPLHVLQVLVPEAIPLEPSPPGTVPKATGPLPSLQVWKERLSDLPVPRFTKLSWEFMVLYGVSLLFLICLVLFLMYL